MKDLLVIHLVDSRDNKFADSYPSNYEDTDSITNFFYFGGDPDYRSSLLNSASLRSKFYTTDAISDAIVKSSYIDAKYILIVDCDDYYDYSGLVKLARSESSDIVSYEYEICYKDHSSTSKSIYYSTPGVFQTKLSDIDLESNLFIHRPFKLFKKDLLDAVFPLPIPLPHLTIGDDTLLMILLVLYVLSHNGSIHHSEEILGIYYKISTNSITSTENKLAKELIAFNEIEEYFRKLLLVSNFYDMDTIQKILYHRIKRITKTLKV